jgi:hypothetical protein
MCCRTVILMFMLSITVAAQTPDAAKPLAVLLGHWEGSGKFSATAMSAAGSIASKMDCAWSPQQRYLTCEQTLTDEKGTHQQLTLYTPAEAANTFQYYTIAGSGKPFSGEVVVKDDTWTYDNVMEQDGKKTEIRTVNTFNAGEEKFKTEFSVDGGPWTTMLEGSSHHASR